MKREEVEGGRRKGEKGFKVLSIREDRKWGKRKQHIGDARRVHLSLTRLLGFLF